MQKTRLEELRAMAYSDYLQTPEWQEKRKKSLKWAGFHCQICKSDAHLNVHHNTYERLGCELPSDLITLCEACHTLFHQQSKLTKKENTSMQLREPAPRQKKAYTFQTKELPQEETPELPDGQLQGVHFTISDPEKLDAVLNRISSWYGDCDEVILVEHGTTAKGLGFVILEWDGCEIDPPFLEVLQNTKAVEDFSVYIRDMGV
jgi:hypothetical protein